MHFISYDGCDIRSKNSLSEQKYILIKNMLQLLQLANCKKYKKCKDRKEKN